MRSSHKNSDSKIHEQTSVDQRKTASAYVMKHNLTKGMESSEFIRGYKAGRESLEPIVEAMIRLLKKHDIEPVWLEEIINEKK